MPPDEPFFRARVRWCDTDQGSAAAVVLAEQLRPLIRDWTDLVRTTQRERTTGQVDALLADLGPLPDADDADDCAFWTAALINPLPALGVCREIRPMVLSAPDAHGRLQWVHAALTDSIARMRKMPPGPFEVEPPPFRPR